MLAAFLFLAGISVALGVVAVQPEAGGGPFFGAGLPQPQPASASLLTRSGGGPTTAVIQPATDRRNACQPIAISSLGITVLGDESMTVWSIRNAGEGRAMAQLIDAGGENLPLGTIYLAARRTLVFAVPDALVHGGLSVATPCDSDSGLVAASIESYDGHAPVLLSIH
ncbi:MAG: hypothetical protein RLO50_06905 [Azospirillaceae bacterium]